MFAFTFGFTVVGALVAYEYTDDRHDIDLEINERKKKTVFNVNIFTPWE